MVVPTYDPKSTTERKMLGSQNLSNERTRGAGVSDFGSGCKVLWAPMLGLSINITIVVIPSL